MASVKWIKITTDMFDNRKIKYLRRLPEGDKIVLIWVMLLTIAGRCNSNGRIFLTQSIPYTTKMLADELDFEESTVRLALEAFERLNMLDTNANLFTIVGWDEYQNIEGMDRIREQNRLRKRKQREQNLLPDMSRDSHVTVTQCHALEEDKDKERDKEKEERITVQQVVDLFHSLCPSYSIVRSLSEARKKAVRARLKTYSLIEFEQVFKKTEASDFLKGKNDRNWTANFDWLMKDANFAKVLDGNYDNKQGSNKATTSYYNFKPGEDPLEGLF